MIRPSFIRVVLGCLLAVLVGVEGGPATAAEATDRWQAGDHLALVANRWLAHLGDVAAVVHDYGSSSLVRLQRTPPPAIASRLHLVSGDDAVGFRSWRGRPGGDVVGVDEALGGLWILRLLGPLDPRWRDLLTEGGVEILAPADGPALVVRCDAVSLHRAASIATSAGEAVIVAAVPLPLEARIERSLRPMLRGEGEAPATRQLTVAGFRGRELPAPVKRVLGGRAVVSADGDRLNRLLLDHPEIGYVEPRWGLALHNNLAARGSLLGVEPVWLDLGYNGDGITVAHNDAGVDLGHPDLAGSVVASSGRMAYGDTAHGTHTAGSIVGRGVTASPTNESGCGDLTPPLPTARGMAWGASLVTNNIFEGGLGGVADMMRWGVARGALVSSNSWGQVDGPSPVVNYSLAAAEADAAVRDADPATPGAQPLTVFFSVGNAGPATATVTSPATAKNVISVGSVQNDRCGAWVPDMQTGPDPAVAVTSSGRGPSQGRVKPDLAAPGSDVLSAESGDPYAVQLWDQPWTGPLLALNTGTSQACALAAGVGAVLHELLWRTRGRRPSPALVRAALVNGAEGADPVPAFDVGWGRLDLARTVLGPAGGEVVRFDRDETGELTTGQVWDTALVVRSSSVPLQITLAWTDVPGEADADHPLVNDLDLVVTAPDGRAYRGNVLEGGWSRPDPGTVRDADNNLEVVRVAAPQAGDWSVEVVGVDVPEAPVGLAGQDFALVVSGDAGPCAEPPAPPVDVGAAAAGDNAIEVWWSAVPGAVRYEVSRSQVPGGRPYLPLTVVEAPSTSTLDTTVEGGLGYHYVVRVFTDCWSAPSAEASAVATGACDLPPSFAGLAAATDRDGVTCALELVWAAASSQCGRPVVYDIYRGGAPGFEPGPSNRAASGVSGTSWIDAGLVSGQPVHYVVRARDQDRQADDGNRVERSATPSGPDDVYLEDGAETGSDGWLRRPGSGADSGTELWFATDDDSWNGSRSWFAADEDRIKDQVLATAEPISIPDGTEVVLEFRHRFRLHRGRDGGRLEVSTNGGLDWIDILGGDGQSVPADPQRWVEGGYVDTIGAPSNPLFLGDGWTGDSRGWLRSAVRLAAFAGRDVLLRWRLGCDDGAGVGGGWWVDDIRMVEAHTCQTCLAPPAPSGLTAEPTADGVALRWQPVAGATTYTVSRSGRPGGPYLELATVAAPDTTWLDATASGGSTYAWVVDASADCRSERSPEVVAIATGRCLEAPRFWGLDRVTDPRDPRCALDLEWRPASAGCAGAQVSYRIYRSSEPGFATGQATLLADDIVATRFRDTTVADGAVLHYRVRAVDSASLAEDDNPVEHDGRTSGPDELLLADSMEGPVDDWWTGPGSSLDSGTEPWSVVNDLAHTGFRSWFCADEPAVKDQVVAMTEDVEIVEASTVLAFHHLFDREPLWDGGRLEYSTDAGASWHDILAGDDRTVASNPGRFVRGGYSGFLSFGTGNPLGGERAWTGSVTGWVETVVALQDFVGLRVRFRWRSGCDGTEALTGWWLDDVELRFTSRCVTATLPSPRSAGGRLP